MFFTLNKNCFQERHRWILLPKSLFILSTALSAQTYGFHSVLNKKNPHPPPPSQRLKDMHWDTNVGRLGWFVVVVCCSHPHSLLPSVFLRSSSLLVLRFVLVLRRESQVEQCNPILAVTSELACSGSVGKAGSDKKAARITSTCWSLTIKWGQEDTTLYPTGKSAPPGRHLV